jgi:signal transduction histidine kinase
MRADATGPFRALCNDFLGVRVAYLAAVGPLSPLVGPPLVYPEGREVLLPNLRDLTSQFNSPQTMCVAVEPEQYGEAMWAVPLWSERGLIGVLLLGEKRDGGLYTQEEIEIARASGERLIDTQASAEMAQRLMALQRQRLAESQVLDRQARRVLHDDVLPLLHTAMLRLSAQGSGVGSRESGARNRGSDPEGIELLAEAHRRISDLLREMPTLATPEVSSLGLVGALQAAVEEELGSAFDRVEWDIKPEGAQEARQVPPLTAEVMYYAAREAIRNAAKYGRNGNSARPLHLRIGVEYRDGLEIAIEDDGVGLDGAGRNGTGSGQGLALHSTMMAVVGGSLATESVPGRYTRVLLALPETTG